MPPRRKITRNTIGKIVKGDLSLADFPLHARIRGQVKVSSFPKDWRSIMLDLAGQGKGDSVWALSIGITRAEMLLTTNTDLEFRDHYFYCREVFQAVWEEQLAKLARRGDLNGIRFGATQFILTNRCGYKSIKGELSGENGNPIAVTSHSSILEKTEEEIAAELEKRNLPKSLFTKQADDIKADG